MPDITARIVNLSEFLNALRGWRADIQDWSEAWPDVVEKPGGFENDARNLFAGEGALGEQGGWPALTEKYAARKLKKWGPKPIEQASERLYRALTDSSSGDAVREYLPRRMRYGTTLPYAYFQQIAHRVSHLGRYGLLGAVVDRMIGRRKPRETYADQTGLVSARPVIDPTAGQIAAKNQILLVWAQTKARRAGFAIAKQLGLGGISPATAAIIGRAGITGTFMGEGI